MSSLLQFGGQITRQGVVLEAYIIREVPWDVGGLKGLTRKVKTEPVDCPTCGRQHAQLYTFTRKPRGMFGPWVVFQYNGDQHAPDLSCPLQLDHVPRDAVRLTPEQNAATWHRE